MDSSLRGSPRNPPVTIVVLNPTHDASVDRRDGGLFETRQIAFCRERREKGSVRNLLMCGRYRLSRRKQMIEEHFDVSRAPVEFSPSRNAGFVFGVSDLALIIRATAEVLAAWLCVQECRNAATTVLQ